MVTVAVVSGALAPSVLLIVAAVWKARLIERRRRAAADVLARKRVGL